MKIAVSACLLGEKVRFDSGHKRDDFVMDALSKYASYVRFCPENLAFSNPRPTIRLVQEKDKALEVHSSKTSQNLTQELFEASKADLQNIAKEELRGIIFKAKSPSCGLGSAKIYQDNGYCEGKGDGVFVTMCKERFPLLPMEEEGRLQDAWLRENFVMQLFAYDSFENFKKNATMGALVSFHQNNKFMLQSKNEVLYRQLGKLVANQKQMSFESLLGEYEILFKTAIAKKSSVKKTRNVLEHMSGFVKTYLTKEEKALLHEQIDDFAAKIIPLIVPLSTIFLYAKKYSVSYLLNQVFLTPYPKELALRSDIKSGK